MVASMSKWQRTFAAAACALNETHSQYNEDLLLLPTLLKARPGGDVWNPGVFLELGAFDGKRLSNTYMLERCFSWTGLLVEANPSNYAKLRVSGRRAAKLHSAVCPQGGTVKFTAKGGQVASQLAEDSKQHRRKWVQQLGKSGKLVSVPCAPLGSLIAKAGIGKPDFLSLDVCS